MSSSLRWSGFSRQPEPTEAYPSDWGETRWNHLLTLHPATTTQTSTAVSRTKHPAIESNGRINGRRLGCPVPRMRFTDDAKSSGTNTVTANPSLLLYVGSCTALPCIVRTTAPRSTRLPQKHTKPKRSLLQVSYLVHPCKPVHVPTPNHQRRIAHPCGPTTRGDTRRNRPIAYEKESRGG